MSAQLLVSVILVNFRTPHLVRRAVDSVKKWETNAQPEIIVVDNTPNDAVLQDQLAQFSDIRILNSPTNLGFAKACNIGVAAAKGRFILLLNSDAFLVSEILPKCLAAWNAHGKCIITCVLLNLDGTLQPHSCRFPKLIRWFLESVSPTWIWNRVDARHFSNLDPLGSRIDWVSGAFLFTSKDTYVGLGGFSEEFFMYAEDLDLCYRARMQGINSYCLPFQAVIHENGGTLDHASERCLAMVDWSRIHYVRRWGGAFRAFLLRLIFSLRSFLRVIGFGMLAMITRRDGFFKKFRLHRSGLEFLWGLRNIH